MIRLIPVLLLGFVCYFVYVQALECGIAEQMGEENLQNVVRKCVGTKSPETEEKSDKATPESEKSSEETVQQTYSASRGMTSRIRRTAFSVNLNGRGRRGFNSENRKIVKREVNSTSETEHEEENDKQSNQRNNDTETSNKCVLQCIFNELGMVDGNGFPEHHRVAEGLLKNAKGREIRDFIQDSTDECFQLMQQGEKLDTCDYATHLVTCLAEKGRSNCADWQIMNLPFHN